MEDICNVTKGLTKRKKRKKNEVLADEKPYVARDECIHTWLLLHLEIMTDWNKSLGILTCWIIALVELLF